MNKKRIFVFGGLCLLGLILIAGGAVAVIMGGNLNLGNYKIINLATPVDNLDGANKGYVDAQASGGGAFSISCGWITTGSPPPVGSCTPGACPAGYTSSVVGCGTNSITNAAIPMSSGTGPNCGLGGLSGIWWYGWRCGDGVTYAFSWGGFGGAAGSCDRVCYK